MSQNLTHLVHPDPDGYIIPEPPKSGTPLTPGRAEKIFRLLIASSGRTTYTARDLQQLLGASDTAVSTITRRMAADGWIGRAPDGRVWWMWLRPRGLDEIQAHHPELLPSQQDEPLPEDQATAVATAEPVVPPAQTVQDLADELLALLRPVLITYLTDYHASKVAVERELSHVLTENEQLRGEVVTASQTVDQLRHRMKMAAASLEIEVTGQAEPQPSP